MSAFLFSHFRVTNVKLINEKNSKIYLKCYSLNLREILEIGTTS